MEVDPRVRHGLERRGIKLDPDPVGGGITAFATWIGPEWVLQRRGLRSLFALSELSRWATPARAREPLLAGTATEVLLSDEISFWSLSPRLDNPELAKAWAARSHEEQFRLTWPTMLETMRVLEQLAETDPPPHGVSRPPDNKSHLIRQGSSAMKRALLRTYGIDPLRIPGAPKECPEGRIALCHGDLTRRNMVCRGPGQYRAIDWEMIALHPVAVEVSYSIVNQLFEVEDIARWERTIAFALPGMCEICGLEPGQALRVLFWGAVAGFVVYAPQAEVPFIDYLPDGLEMIASLAADSRT